MQPLTLRRNFSWTFAGNGIYAASQWGMLVVLAKLGNSEMVGQFTLGLAITAPIVTFTNLQLRGLQATDARQKYCFGDYLGLRIISTCLALVLIGGIAIFAGYQRPTALVIFLVGISKSIESISDVFYGLLQQHERMDRIAISLIIKGPLSLFLLSLGIYFSKSLVWGMVGLIIAWLTVLMISDIQNSALLLKHLRETQSNSRTVVEKALYSLYPHWQSKKLLKLASLALPMGFVMLLVSLNVNIPRYVLEQNLGVKELGIFAAISYLLIAGKFVVSSLATSADARLAKYHASGDMLAFRRLMFKLLGVGSFLGLIGILSALIAGSKILSILYKSEYGKHNDVFILIMIAALIDYLFAFLGHGMTAARHFRIQVPLLVTVLITSVMSSLLLVPLLGMKGAALSLILSTFVGALGSLGVLIYAYNKRLKDIKL
jgi:O-antigen/teichoic acid export membrane protein